MAVTGRLSSNDPNLQNIPIRNAEGRRIREAFIAPPGHRIVSADYSQIELRIMAHLSQDASLLGRLRLRRRCASAHRGGSLRRAPRAELTSEQRRYAKVINFGLIYGMSAFGLASQLGVERSAAQQYMDRYFARYPGVADYMQRTRESAREKGYVETVFGRRLLHDGYQRVQQSAPPGRRARRDQCADAGHRRRPDQARDDRGARAGSTSAALRSALVMQVHDELVLEVPDSELELITHELPEADDRRGAARCSAGSRCRRRRQLGQGALVRRQALARLAHRAHVRAA